MVVLIIEQISIQREFYTFDYKWGVGGGGGGEGSCPGQGDGYARDWSGVASKMHRGSSVGLYWAMKLDTVSCATLRLANQNKRYKTVP